MEDITAPPRRVRMVDSDDFWKQTIFESYLGRVADAVIDLLAPHRVPETVRAQDLRLLTFRELRRLIAGSQLPGRQATFQEVLDDLIEQCSVEMLTAYGAASASEHPEWSDGYAALLSQVEREVFAALDDQSVFDFFQSSTNDSSPRADIAALDPALPDHGRRRELVANCEDGRRIVVTVDPIRTPELESEIEVVRLRSVLLDVDNCRQASARFYLVSPLSLPVDLVEAFYAFDACDDEMSGAGYELIKSYGPEQLFAGGDFLFFRTCVVDPNLRGAGVGRDFLMDTLTVIKDRFAGVAGLGLMFAPDQYRVLPFEDYPPTIAEAYLADSRRLMAYWQRIKHEALAIVGAPDGNGHEFTIECGYSPTREAVAEWMKEVLRKRQRAQDARPPFH